jgi:mannose-6-phosphate isomerase-like protein (cupin superfamily)
VTSSPLSSSNSSGSKKGQKFWLLGDTYTFHITGSETDRKYAVSELSSPPGGGPPLHSHTKETEGFYVIDGKFSFQYGDDNTVAEVGILIDNEETFSPPSMDTIDISKIVRIAHEKYGLNVIMPKAPE